MRRNGTGVQRGRLGAAEDDGLIAAQPGGLVDRSRDAPDIGEPALAPDHEEGQRFRDRVEAREVRVAAIEDVEGARFEDQPIELCDIGGFAVGDRDERRDGASQIEQGVQLHRGFGPPEAGPREQGQAEVDRRRIERVRGLGQRDREGLVQIQAPGVPDEDLREVGEDPPIAGLVRIGERAPRDAAAEPDVVQLRLEGAQARLDVAQALAVRQLGEDQTEQVVVAGERPEPARARVPRHAALEGAPGDDVHHLGEHGAARIHWPVLSVPRCGGTSGQSLRENSSRYQASVPVTF